MHSWYASSSNPVKHIGSSSSAYRRRCCKGRPTRFIYFFLDSSVLKAPTVCALSATSNYHALCCMLNYGNTLVQLLHCLSLSSCQLESTLPTAAQLLLSKSQQGDLVGYHLRLSNVLETISWPRCEQIYATITSHRKQEIFLYEYFMHWVLLPTKNS
jgi:hypothetical protein